VNRASLTHCIICYYAVTLLYCIEHISKYDYKIQYEDISKLFLLEKPDDRYTAFVISLEKPIRQGQQKYQHLVLQVCILILH
jgi:hypothetical protein